MIDRVAEEELTILYIMNAAKGIPSNYLEHAKKEIIITYLLRNSFIN